MARRRAECGARPGGDASGRRQRTARPWRERAAAPRRWRGRM